MLGDITVVDQIYIACGYTDMRKSIDGLVTLVHEHFNMETVAEVYLQEGAAMSQTIKIDQLADNNISGQKDKRTHHR